MPLFGKGTWSTHRGRKLHANQEDDVRAEEIKQVIDKGIFYIDTAERYSNGYGEKIIGTAIKGFSREKLFLVSKASSEHLTYDNFIASAKSSIKNLQSSYLDLYLIHQFNPKIPFPETMRAADYLLEKKLIRHIGVCNFTEAQLKEAQSYTKNKIVANQIHYNIMFREPEQNGIVSFCQKNDVMIIAWRPFQQELLTKETALLLDEMGRKYNKTASQIATIWLMSQPNTVVLSRLKTSAEVQMIIDASTVKMEAKDIEKLNHEIN